jgi:hypothetical protein
MLCLSLRRRKKDRVEEKGKIGFGVSSCNVIYDIYPFGSERIRSGIKNSKRDRFNGALKLQNIKKKRGSLFHMTALESYTCRAELSGEKSGIGMDFCERWMVCKQHMKPKSSEGAVWSGAKHGNSLSPRWGK